VRRLSDPTCKGEDDKVRLLAAGQVREPRKGRSRVCFIRSHQHSNYKSVRECSKCSRMLRQCTIMSHIPQIVGVCMSILSQAKIPLVSCWTIDTKSVLLYRQLNCNFIHWNTKYITRVNHNFGSKLRPENESTIFFNQIQKVLRSPDSSTSDCVVPNLDLGMRSPEILVLQKRNPEYVHRGLTYVSRVRTPRNSVRRQMRTSVHVR